MSITEKLLLNWYFSMKIFFRKIRMIFYIENWLWKSTFGTFWHLPTTDQFSKFNKFLWVCWFLCKNLSNFVSLVLKLHNRKCHILSWPWSWKLHHLGHNNTCLGAEIGWHFKYISHIFWPVAVARVLSIL